MYTSVLEGRVHKADPFTKKEAKPLFENNNWIAGEWVELPEKRDKFHATLEEALTLGSSIYKVDVVIENDGTTKKAKLTEKCDDPAWFAKLQTLYAKLTDIELADKAAPKPVARLKQTVGGSYSHTFDPYMRANAYGRFDAINSARNAIRRKVKSKVKYAIKVGKLSETRALRDSLESMAHIVANGLCILACDDMYISPIVSFQTLQDLDLILKGYVPSGGKFCHIDDL